MNHFLTDAAQVFVESIMGDAKEIFQLYSRDAVLPMVLTVGDVETLANAWRCHICGKLLNNSDPGLACCAMLKTTDIKLDLLSDYNMSLMISKGIRGDVGMLQLITLTWMISMRSNRLPI
ncbi:hypothetical protein J6590_024848 [Homalodisca vitripennis]|nr:hypothetical protein J6590_024848 [Homalodisca vitripennis]